MMLKKVGEIIHNNSNICDLKIMAYFHSHVLNVKLKCFHINFSDLVAMLRTQLLEYLKTPHLDLSSIDSNNIMDMVTSCLRQGVGGDLELMQVLAATLRCIPAGDLHTQTWEMLLGHSQFLPAMLGKNKNHVRKYKNYL